TVADAGAQGQEALQEDEDRGRLPQQLRGTEQEARAQTDAQPQADQGVQAGVAQDQPIRAQAPQSPQTNAQGKGGEGDLARTEGIAQEGGGPDAGGQKAGEIQEDAQQADRPRAGDQRHGGSGRAGHAEEV